MSAKMRKRKVKVLEAEILGRDDPPFDDRLDRMLQSLRAVWRSSPPHVRTIIERMVERDVIIPGANVIVAVEMAKVRA